MVDFMDTLVGQTLLGYRLDRLLGRGGSAAVFLGISNLDASIVRAIKIIDPSLAADPSFVQRTAAEARILETLSHPNVVRFYGLRWVELLGRNLLCMELEYLDGASLADRRGTVHDEATVLRILTEVCQGLAPVHAAGLVHRDLKPENILLTRAGAVKLVDFGIAREAVRPAGAHAVTQFGMVIGTPAYLAPELIHGAPPSPASDVYALGILGYELLLGHHPLHTPGAAEPTWTEYVLLHEQQPLPPLPAKSRAIEAVLRDAASKAPAARPPDAAKLLQRLIAGPVTPRGEPLSPTRETPSAHATQFAMPVRSASEGAPAPSGAMPLSPTGGEATPTQRVTEVLPRPNAGTVFSLPSATPPAAPAPAASPQPTVGPRGGPRWAVGAVIGVVVMGVIGGIGVAARSSSDGSAGSTNEGSSLAATPFAPAMGGSPVARQTESVTAPPPPPPPVQVHPPAQVQVPPPPPPSYPDVRCAAWPRRDFHLRAEPILAPVGASYSRGTPVGLLASENLMRDGSRMFRVRILSNGDLGYIFLRADEMDRGCPRDLIVSAEGALCMYRCMQRNGDDPSCSSECDSD